MKTWHYILIGGALLIGAFFVLRSRAAPSASVKVGTGAQDAGAPALPDVNMANPTTAKYLTFASVAKLYTIRRV